MTDSSHLCPLLLNFDLGKLSWYSVICNVKIKTVFFRLKNLEITALITQAAIFQKHYALLFLLSIPMFIFAYILSYST